jgi:hypothetical protein
MAATITASSLNGNAASHTSGKSTAAAIATGQHKTNNTHQHKNINSIFIATLPPGRYTTGRLQSSEASKQLALTQCPSITFH